jgi:CRP-like cAMP-binding protein
MDTALTADVPSRSAATARELRACVLFQDFTDRELATVIPLVEERVVPAGAAIVREGEPAVELFVIRDGAVEVTKRAPGASNDHQLGTLHAGDTFGEMTFIDRAPRSATVRAIAPTRVAVLRMDDLDAATADDAAVRARMLRNLSAFLARRLRGVSEVTAGALEQELQLAQTRVAMGTFLTYVILMMVAYSFAMRLVYDLAKSAADTSIVSIPIILGFTIPLYVMMRRSGEPIATYGLTLRNVGAAIVDTLRWTVPLLVLATILKIALVRNVASLAGAPVFRLGGFLDPTATSSEAWFALVMSLAYIVIVPLQEFVARGALQSPLQRFLVGRYATVLAIVIANAMFTASHLYLSTTFALISLLPGLLWGWLYARHGTLVAPILSHILVGWWGFFVLGFDKILV